MATTLAGMMAGFIGFASGRVPQGGQIIVNKPGDVPTLGRGDALTVVTWNIHYGGGPTLDRGRGQSQAEVFGYLDAIAGHLRSWDADIVALQEVDRRALRSFDVDQLRWLQEATGLAYAAWTPTWDATWVPHPGLHPRDHIGRVLSGQVILSRFPLNDDHHIRLPQPEVNGAIYNKFYLHRHLTEVTARLGPDHDLRVINAHLEAFDPTNRRKHAARAVELLTSRGGNPALFLGDMNCTPPEASVRRAFDDEPETDMSGDNTIGILRSVAGMTEVVPEEVYASDERAWFTFPAHRPNRRLDYLFYSDHLSLISAEVPSMDSPPSDHLPVIARFELQ